MKKFFYMILNIFTVICVLTFISPSIPAQDLDVAYVESPPEVVEVMMEISDIGSGDYVIDLGTGDGRILIAAAKRGAVGHGIDLDPVRVKEAIANADREGVSDIVSFIEEDLFDSKLEGADVITMYLNSEVNLKLRPTLLSLKPGTRIISHNFDMGDWKPDRYQQTLSNNKGNFLFHDVYYWVVPADASGLWQWQSDQDIYEMKIQQNYQVIDATLTVNNQSLQIETTYLIGNRINMSAMNPQTDLKLMLSGTINEDTITGYLLKRQGDIQTVSAWHVKR